jgi:predicted GNAT family N-acyltransferase
MKTVIPIEWGSPEYDLSVKIRYDVLRKPIGLEFTEEQLEAEWSDIHLACYNGNAEMMGSLILTVNDDNTLKMRQVAVAEHCQRHGVGRCLVEAAEAYAKHNKHPKIVLNARELAIPFYLELDYELIGEPFIEVGIPHNKMHKLLS